MNGPELPGKMIFKFLKYNCIYFRVPKVASSSLLITFRKVDSVEKVEEYDSHIFKFAFVRDPFDRLASCYRHLIQRPGVGSVYEEPGIYKNMPFFEFVDVISEMKVEEMNIHWRPQYTFIPEKPDLIGKFENLNEDYAKIVQKIGIKNPPELLWENKTDKTNFKDYYNEEIIKKVMDIYKKDFEIFGYEKPKD